MDKKVVGERIRIFRLEVLHLSQKEFAAKIGINPATMNRIENGFRVPDFGTCVALATRTVISMDWLFLGEGPMRRAHYEPDPVDWKIMNEAIERICAFANDYEVEPAKAAQFINMYYDEFAKREDVTPEQRREKAEKFLKLIKPA